ncbi:MAG: adenylosuccinate lyase [Deltaproteobacteria bacterium]|jgi:adenylosuccinate lyase|nr:adenylosuccinate lyase [Deltaproteobacteria bacterium]
MIDRYSRPEMAEIWSLKNQYNSWLKVELAVAAGQAEMGLIPADAALEIQEKARFEEKRIEEIEKAVGHDVIAFITCLEENIGPSARFLHFGLTSSDILDTSLALRLLEAGWKIHNDVRELMETLREKALKHKDTPIIGRSHGIHAEPTTFGLKLAAFYAEFERHERRLHLALEDLRVGQLSGPVGNYSAASLSPELEERVLARLGLKPAVISSQIIARDTHAFFFQTLAILVTTAEKLAVEIRHLARTEVGEVEEAFGKGQKGSSAMPHKKNPIGSENITGLARLVRSLAQAAVDDMVLWHERDISHSSVERIIAPDATVYTNYLLNRLNSLVRGLVVRPDRMLRNLELTRGLFNSQEVMLALCQKGLTRVKAYELVQKQALAASEGAGDFLELLMNNPKIKERLSQEELTAIFKPDRFARWTGIILERVFGQGASARIIPSGNEEKHF